MIARSADQVRARERRVRGRPRLAPGAGHRKAASADGRDCHPLRKSYRIDPRAGPASDPRVSPAKARRGLRSLAHIPRGRGCGGIGSQRASPRQGASGHPNRQDGTAARRERRGACRAPRGWPKPGGTRARYIGPARWRFANATKGPRGGGRSKPCRSPRRDQRERRARPDKGPRANSPLERER